MINFKEYLILEASTKKPAKPKSNKTKKPAVEKFSPGDSAGKIWEILKGKHYNNGNFADDFRVEGKKPEDIHNIMAEKLFGPKYKDHPIYNNMRKSAEESAEMTQRYLSARYGHDRNKGFGRVAWTSQASDPESYLGSKIQKSVADSMMDLSHGKSHAISEKVTAAKSPINYANPGAKSFESFAGLNPGELTQYNQAHQDVVDQVQASRKDKTGENKERYIKRITRAKDPKTELTPAERRHRDLIINSYNERNRNYGRGMRQGISAMADMDKKDGGSRVRDAIFKLVTPSSETPTTVSHTELNPDGTVHRHRVYDVHDHINQYLDHFDNFHITQSDKDPASLTIHGRHKQTGEIMPILTTAIFGEKHLGSPRGSTVLRSENHSSVKYNGELDSHGVHGDTLEQHAKGMTPQREPTQQQQAAAVAAQTPEHKENTQGVMDWLSGRERKHFSDFRSQPQQRRVAQTGSPFQSMARPGVSRTIPEPIHYRDSSGSINESFLGEAKEQNFPHINEWMAARDNSHLSNKVDTGEYYREVGAKLNTAKPDYSIRGLSINEFTQNSRPINKHLIDTNNRPNEKLTLGQREKIPHLDSFIQDNKIPHDVTTYSAVGFDPRKKIVDNSMDSPAYISTTPDKLIAKDYIDRGSKSKQKAKHIISFNLKKGQAAANITAHSSTDKNRSNNPRFRPHNEVLIGRGARLHYSHTDSYQDPKTGTKFHVHHMSVTHGDVDPSVKLLPKPGLSYREHTDGTHGGFAF